MRIYNKESAEGNIWVVEVSNEDLSDDPETAALGWKKLSDSVLSKIRSNGSSNQVSIPLVAIDLTEANPHPGKFEKWVLYGRMFKAATLLGFVRERAGKVVFCGLRWRASGGDLSVAATLEDAFVELRRHRQSTTTDEDLSKSEVKARVGNSKLCLVGRARDLDELTKEFGHFGIDVKPPDSISDGDKVVFCVSACDGPMPDTRKSVALIQGKTILPIAIILVQAEAVDDGSLRELVNCEERELLVSGGGLPAEVADNLPLLLDLDPSLVNKITDLAQEAKTEVYCSTPR